MENIFRLSINRENKGSHALNLTNISAEKAIDIKIQVHRIVSRGEEGITEPTNIQVSGIKSLSPGATSPLEIDSRIAEMEMSLMEIDIMHTYQYRKNDSGYSLRVFFTHPKEAVQIINLWVKQRT